MDSSRNVFMGKVEEDAGLVSLRAEVPETLHLAMRHFIECHPNWDQYRLFQAALAGFLFQNGIRNRGVTRCYLANLFPAQAGFCGALPHTQKSPPSRQATLPATSLGLPARKV